MKAYEKSKQLLDLKFDANPHEEIKERKSGKIVLIGGGISKRNASPASKPSRSKLKAGEIGKTNHRYFMRQARQSHSLQIVEDIS